MWSIDKWMLAICSASPASRCRAHKLACWHTALLFHSGMWSCQLVAGLGHPPGFEAHKVFFLDLYQLNLSSCCDLGPWEARHIIQSWSGKCAATRSSRAPRVFSTSHRVTESHSVQETLHFHMWEVVPHLSLDVRMILFCLTSPPKESSLQDRSMSFCHHVLLRCKILLPFLL